MHHSLLVVALSLVACSGDEARPGAVTTDEARQLDEAAEMLDADSIDATSMIDNGQDDR